MALRVLPGRLVKNSLLSRNALVLVICCAFVLLAAAGFAKDNIAGTLAQQQGWLSTAIGSDPGSPSEVTVERLENGAYQYVVNGEPQVFIGMGYNPIYRFLSDEERAARYDYDFDLLCRAGVNHITGWDADKGYEQDKFDELTLDRAHDHGLGVVMAINLPPEGDYTDPEFQQQIIDDAQVKVMRFKDHPALRMWGVGNEVLSEMDSARHRYAFGRFYLRLADLVHEWDPNHPVIYREAEDTFVETMVRWLKKSGDDRPWLQYGMNVYTPNLQPIIEYWPLFEFGRPLFVSEFGAEAIWLGSRAEGYATMWRWIREHPDYVMGGAPYVWTTEGPEPTDVIWGLMDANSQPVDATFDMLSEMWRQENQQPRCR